MAQWDLVGKCDGLTADPQTGELIATVNEDAHSSLYLIRPGGAAVHYTYARPLPSDGGTDAISVYHGLVLISASAPGTTGAAAPQARYPAVYRATFDPAAQTVRLRELFGDEARAKSRTRVRNTASPCASRSPTRTRTRMSRRTRGGSPASSCSRARATRSRSSSPAPAVGTSRCRFSS